jgi:hypothetical protein
VHAGLINNGRAQRKRRALSAPSVERSSDRGLALPKNERNDVKVKPDQS